MAEKKPDEDRGTQNELEVLKIIIENNVRLKEKVLKRIRELRLQGVGNK
jgi:hypothetical protein